MTYVSRQPVDHPDPAQDPTPPLNTSVLSAARKIYSSYCQTHSEPHQPVGVAVDRDTYRGHLIFNGKPILLPHECFVPFSQIEATEQV